jgi:hypothetical protein
VSLANFHLGHGNLSGFGTNVTVQAGQRLLALSSGTARDPSDPAYEDVGGFDKGYTSGHPQGFPKESPSCPGVTTGSPHDATGLEVKIRVPTNAVGFEYDQKFYTYEWPAYVCSQYNDFFVAMLTPTPVGQTDGNIAFDSLGNPININNDLLEVCGCTSGPPCAAGGQSFTCSLGVTDLAGTGFETHAATGWLTTRVPVQGGSEITIRFAAYDSADGIQDSTVLLDNWRWLSTGAPAGPVTIAKP